MAFPLQYRFEAAALLGRQSGAPPSIRAQLHRKLLPQAIFAADGGTGLRRCAEPVHRLGTIVEDRLHARRERTGRTARLGRRGKLGRGEDGTFPAEIFVVPAILTWNPLPPRVESQ